jgi:hypothetical protein
MIWNKMKYVALAALLAVGLAGIGARHWSMASDAQHNPTALHDGGVGFEATTGMGWSSSPAGEAPPTAGARRREAVIRLPAGTFVKEVDAPPYGSGRFTWIFEDDRLRGLMEAKVMGVEVEVSFDAEYSLSSNGTIYGLMTGFRLDHLRLPEGEAFKELQPFVGLWPVVEPLVNDVMIDLPFSFRFAVQGERLVISNFRMLLAGALGKGGSIAAAMAFDSNDSAAKTAAGVLLEAQALGVPFEGTYTAASREKPTASRRPLILKPSSAVEKKTAR